MRSTWSALPADLRWCSLRHARCASPTPECDCKHCRLGLGQFGDDTAFCRHAHIEHGLALGLEEDEEAFGLLVRGHEGHFHRQVTGPLDEVAPRDMPMA